MSGANNRKDNEASNHEDESNYWKYSFITLNYVANFPNNDPTPTTNICNMSNLFRNIMGFNHCPNVTPPAILLNVLDWKYFKSIVWCHRIKNFIKICIFRCLMLHLGVIMISTSNIVFKTLPNVK